MAIKPGTDNYRSGSIGGQVEGNHKAIPNAGSEKPSGWMGGHNTGASTSSKKGGKGPAQDVDSGDL
jgi:hypothetical protein